MEVIAAIVATWFIMQVVATAALLVVFGVAAR